MANQENQAFSPDRFVDFQQTEHRDLFPGAEPVWAAIGRISDYLAGKENFCVRGTVSPGAFVGDRVHIGEGTIVEHGAVIQGPCWIGKNCVIRSGAYLRGDVIAGDGCVLGNSCEFKNCVLFDGCEVPHFNYVGDSILGYRAHLGAGVILSNVRLDREIVRVKSPEGELIETGLFKFGAIVGDFAEIGCNSVLSPGSVIGRRSVLYPGTQWRGVLADEKVVRLVQNQEIIDRN